MTPGERAPYEEGNVERATHGAHSDRLVEPRARQLAPEVFAANAHLDEARDGPAVLRLAVIYSRIRLVYGWLADQADSVFSDRQTGDLHPVFERLEKWEAAAERAEEKLAISPLTRAKLGLDELKARATLRDFMEAPDAQDGDTEESGQ